MAHFIGREVRLDHTPVRSELLDGIVHVRRHQICQFFRPDGFVPGVPVITGPGLADASQLNDHVGSLSHGGQVLFPDGDYVFVAVSIGAGAQHPTDVV